jgi:beta-lactamase regulating signal transducer with metallopeptidase domain
VADFGQFFADCFRSGVLLSSACALLVVPIAAWAALRFALPPLRGMSGDPAWQAGLASIAAILPGTLVLILALAALIGGMHAACFQTAAGRILYSIIATVLVLSLVRATVLARRRAAESNALLRLTVAPSGRLAEIAARLTVAARELPVDEPFCALACVYRPAVIVSSRSLRDMNDAELAAALLHERGHARRGDQAVAAAIAFLVDLFPVPSSSFVSIYRDAREFAADAHALRHASPEDLAGALLTFTRDRQRVADMAALHGDSSFRRRLAALLVQGERSVTLSAWNRFYVSTIIAAVIVLGIAPAASSLIRPTPCDHAASSTMVM